MSKIGKKPIDIPKTVKVSLAGNLFKAENNTGQRSFNIPNGIEVEIKDDKIFVKLIDKEKNNLFGTARTIINNMISGLVNKYVKTLTVVGTGYKAEVKPAEHKLLLTVGYTGATPYIYPDTISIEVDKQNNIKISGIDKQLVGKVSSEIRKISPPEPYQGKGIRYIGEFVRKKAGKTQATAGTGTGGK